MVSCEMHFKLDKKVELEASDVDPHLGRRKLDAFNQQGICIFERRNEEGKITCSHFIGNKPPRESVNAKDISNSCPVVLKSRTMGE